MASYLGTRAGLFPIALRPVVDFPPARGSIFEDPGDEKSWHKSQRSESLNRFYEGREPSWYASAIAPLRGAERVLDLGCGPGIALQALREQGSSSVWGVDRWPAFTSGPGSAGHVIAHDLTLPMPFLASGSFDGVFSHYALDYLSPIGMRQVLREAQRLLVPGGQLVIYVAAVGLGSRDETRTAAYAPSALRILLAEAGFDEVDVEAPGDGRNSVAKARRSTSGPQLGEAGMGEIRTPVQGETQLSASFSDGDRLECELAAPGRKATLAVDAPTPSAEKSSVSVCARVQRSALAGAELQIWVWRGLSPVVCECARLEFAPTELRLRCAGGRVEHLSSWSPGELFVEPPGNAHARSGDLPAGSSLSEAERGAEGRQVVVEAPGDIHADVVGRLGPGQNRFLIRRASAVEVATIDAEWLSGRAHGIVCAAEELEGERMRELLLWAGWRQALVFLGGSDWQSILAVASRRKSELQSPVVLVDPALRGRGAAQPLPQEVASFAAANTRFFVLLDGESRSQAAGEDLKRFPRRLLHGGPPGNDEASMREAGEALRYLTERTVLMRLRQAHDRSPAEVGRRRALP